MKCGGDAIIADSAATPPFVRIFSAISKLEHLLNQSSVAFRLGLGRGD